MPVEPPPCVWDFPDRRRRRRRRRDRRGRRRPRAGHAARGVPARAVPDVRGAHARVVVARSARGHPARRLPLQPIAAPRDRPLRGARRHRLRRRDARVRRPEPAARMDRRVVRRRVHAAARARAGRIRSRRGRTVCSSAGLYGVRIGRFFAGESMFHRVTDASKVACWATVELLKLDGATLFDVQWTTPHLRTLGAIDVERARVPAVASFGVMEPVQIFHNPSCSKSRGALEILEERGVDADVVRYLDAPPDRATLERILDAIPDEPIALVRTGDDEVQGRRPHQGRRADARAGDRRAAGAPGSDGTARRVRRRPRRDRAAVGEGARPPRLTAEGNLAPMTMPSPRRRARRGQGVARGELEPRSDGRRVVGHPRPLRLRGADVPRGRVGQGLAARSRDVVNEAIAEHGAIGPPAGLGYLLDRADDRRARQRAPEGRGSPAHPQRAGRVVPALLRARRRFRPREPRDARR